MLSRVELIGHLGQKPVLRETGDGTPVTNLSISTSNDYYKEGEQVECDPDWHQVAVFGPQAVAICDKLDKGSKVQVDGKNKYKTIEGADGYKHQVCTIRASSVMFL